MNKDSIKLSYDDEDIVDRIEAFAHAHPSKSWRQFVRLNKTSIVLEAVPK